MNTFHQHQRQEASVPVPLFSSSWIALYVYLRDNLSRGSGLTAPADDSPKTGHVARTH